MNKSTYETPLNSRYASQEMQYIFSPDKKFTTWRRLWVALAESEMELGLPVTQAQVDELKAHIDDIDYEKLRKVIDEIRRRSDAKCARVLREGASIVLAGRPNVGKSSLMNALLNQNRAIVTEVPGTTRDVLTERINIGGIVAELSDTAGQRDTEDPVERIGVDRARRAAEVADVVLVVLDAASELDDEDAEWVRRCDDRTIICLNKRDLEPKTQLEMLSALTDGMILEISARTGQGIDRLMDELARRVALNDADGGYMMAQRHIELAQSAASSLETAIEAIEGGLPLDMAAIDIRLAMEKLSEITGENATEAVIDRVFSKFCVGK